MKYIDKIYGEFELSGVIINSSINLKKQIDKLRDTGMVNEKFRQKKRMVNPEILVNNQIVKLSDLN